MLFDFIHIIHSKTYNSLKKLYFLCKNSKSFHCSPFLLKTRPLWGTNKRNRNLKLVFKSQLMADPKIEETLSPLRASVKEQGDYVRHLKAAGAPELDIKKAVADLKIRKKILDEKELELMPAAAYFDRAKLEDLLRRRFFYDQSFSIYGGISGLYDFGPIGCALKTNILNEWRKFFVLEEQMLEVDCSVLTPEPVLKASGHVDRFADIMVRDVVNGECFRLDHLIKSHLEKLWADKSTTGELKKDCEKILTELDNYNIEQQHEILKRFNMKSPLTGNDLSAPIEFNLMFTTYIGPSGLIKGFLRPETAQGIFVNFKRLLEFNHGKLPFAVAQIGNAFRNEISPRSGLLRVREFTMAEIEHFCDPSDKSCDKFLYVADQKMTLYSACNQMDGKPAEILTIGEAVHKNLVKNETLGYFMARIYQFLTTIGIDESRLRFRQHMLNEMAHYACDCWDAECLTSFGWVECVGCADRSAYDLTQHHNATGVRLSAEKKLLKPETVKVTKVYPVKKELGKTFKQNMNKICDKLNELSIEEISRLEEELRDTKQYLLKTEDQNYTLTENMVEIKLFEETRHVAEIIPNVIEPSFGIGRIMYSIFEHNFHIREQDEYRTYIHLPPLIAPIKCSLLPLSSNEEFVPLIKLIASDLRKHGLSYKIDDSAGSIGKRYTRSDEIGIPFGITIDFDSLKEPHTVTLREMHSTNQLRILVHEVASVITELTNASITWKNAENRFPKFVAQQASKDK